jgi:endonuclease III
MSPKQFVEKVVKAYEGGVGVFATKINAEDLIPPGLSVKQKALYLFYVLQLDYAMKSQLLYKGAKQLHVKHSNFFTPKYILSLPQEELQSIIKKYLRPRYINEAVRRYVQNSHTLAEKYESDPRKIFVTANNCTEVLQRLKDLRGFGPKIGNFFARTMINTFNYEYADIETILPPVDVHDVRIAYLMGYISTDEMSTKNIQHVKKLWNKACQDAKVSWLVFDKALWLLGSEGRPKSKEDVLDII